MLSKPLYLLFILLALPIAGIFAQRIHFFKGSWEEAQEQARAENKLLFVDIYASWYAPCQYMHSQVMEEPELAEFFNAHFIVFQASVDSKQGKKFVQDYVITYYPTYLYMNPDGFVRLETWGTKSAEQLLAEARNLATPNQDIYTRMEEFRNGNGNLQFALQLGQDCLAAGEINMAEEIAHTIWYSADDEQLLSADYFPFVYLERLRFKSRIFQHVAAYRKSFEQVLGAGLVSEYMHKVVDAELQAVVTDPNTNFNQRIADFTEQVRKYLPKDANYYQSKAGCRCFCINYPGSDKCLSERANYLNRYCRDTDELDASADYVATYMPFPDELEQALVWIDRALANSQNGKYKLTKAKLLYGLERYDGCKKLLNALLNAQEIDPVVQEQAQNLSDMLQQLGY